MLITSPPTNQPQNYATTARADHAPSSDSSRFSLTKIYDLTILDSSKSSVKSDEDAVETPLIASLQKESLPTLQ